MKRLWPLGVAAVFGAAIGSGSMAFYLYNYQRAVENNTTRIERLEKKPRQICPCPTKPREHPASAEAQRPWWRRVWR